SALERAARRAQAVDELRGLALGELGRRGAVEVLAALVDLVEAELVLVAGDSVDRLDLGRGRRRALHDRDRLATGAAGAPRSQRPLNDRAPAATAAWQIAKWPLSSLGTWSRVELTVFSPFSCALSKRPA